MSIYKKNQNTNTLKSIKLINWNNENNPDNLNLVNQLVELGLTKYEAMVYLATATNGESSAREISELTSIPYGKVYEVINNLTRKGFLYNTTTKPLKCNAVEPKEALTNVKIKISEKISTIETALEKIEDLPKKENEKVMVIEGQRNIYRKILNFLDKKDKISICGGIYLIKKILFKIDELKSSKEKVIDKVVLFYNKKDNKEEIQKIKKSIEDLFHWKIKLISDDKNEPCILLNKNVCLIIEEFKKSPFNPEPLRALLFSNSSLIPFLNSYIEEL